MDISEHVRSTISRIGGGPQCEDIGADDQIWEIAGPLVVNGTVEGTATFPASGTVLTAAHVFEAISRHVMGRELVAPGNVKYETASVPAEAVRSNGRHSETQRVLAGVASAYSDIALLASRSNVGLTGPSDPLRLAVTPPDRGSVVAAFGVSGAVSGNQLQLRYWRSVGRVVEVLPTGRDQRLPFACLKVDCELRPGMSGGPVFDDQGRVIGLVCSGGLEEYVALVWPSLASEVGHGTGGEPLTSPIRALQVLLTAGVAIDGLERFSITGDGTPLYRHGLGTKNSPLVVEQRVVDTNPAETLTVHEVFDGGLTFSFTPKATGAEFVKMARKCAEYLAPGILCRLDTSREVVRMRWPPGTPLTAPIVKLLRAAEEEVARVLQDRERRFHDRWEMDVLLNRRR